MIKITNRKINKIVYTNGYPNNYYGTQYYLCILGYEFPIYFKMESPADNNWDNMSNVDGSFNK